MASSIWIGWWVATITMPPFFLWSAIIYSSNLNPSSSSATDGSSSNQIGLSSASNLASWTLFRWPIDSLRGFSFANLPSPISSNAGIDLPSFLSSSSNHTTFSKTVNLSLMASLRESQLSWSLYWSKTPAFVTSWPFQRTCPADGRLNPANMRNIVVFPEPFAPDSTSALPSWRETFVCRRIWCPFLMQDTLLRRSLGSGAFRRDIRVLGIQATKSSPIV